MRVRLPPLLTTLLVWAPAGCSPAPQDGRVRVLLEQGRVSAAEQALAGRGDPAATALRAEAERLRARQDEVRGAIVALEARRGELPRTELLQRFSELREGAGDPVAREWVEVALSRTQDWLAASGAGRRAPVSSPTRPATAPGPPEGAVPEPLAPELQPAVVHRSPGPSAPDPVRAAAEAPGPSPAPPAGDTDQARVASTPGAPDDPPGAVDPAAGAEEGPSPDPAALLRLLQRGEPEERTRALVELRRVDPLGDTWLPVLRELEEDARGALGRRLVAGLEDLAALRLELDERRAHALELIRDEERYFYPHEPELVGADRAALYRQVQAEVERRVGRVRALWEDPRSVDVPASARRALADLRWLADRGHLRGERLPAWSISVGPDTRSLDLRGLALDREDLALLRYNRAVQAHNERLWRQPGAPAAEEIEQVRLTGDYRELLGLRRLAWNPALQRAARQHALYLANGGPFGHSQPDPERATPLLRMRLEGYPDPLTENTTGMAASAARAHRRWLGSSSHHRNLLLPEALEMATAHEASFWNQNLGQDDAFQQFLDPWQD